MVDDSFPPLRTPRVRHTAHPIGERELETHTAVALALPADACALAGVPHGRVIAARIRRAGYTLGDAKPFVLDLPNERGTRLAIAGLRETTSAFERRTLARRMIAALLEQRSENIALAVSGHSEEATAAMLEALLAAALAADGAMPSFKNGNDERRALAEVHIFGAFPAARRARTVAAARGNNLARYLTALPPNMLTPGAYRRRAEALARARRWRSEFLDLEALERLRAGAFLAVARGSPEPDAGILRLSYRPRGPRAAAPIALVGKGICFDTGGVNLKSAKHMHGMHGDMAGSAAALGTLLALAELEVDFPVDCWLALAQNHIGPKAYRPNEVVTAANGTTIEIVHTDAEGRMILADTLHLAGRGKPRLIVDFATLTGACIGALGTRMSGVLTNRSGWIAPLIEAGEASGERVWPFPLPEDYGELLKSDVADIKQCTIESDADQILAGLFLKRFVPQDTAWVHVDLAAANNKGGLADVPTDVTGFGVRFALELLDRCLPR